MSMSPLFQWLFYRLEANHVSFAEHSGTHLDAPAHTALAPGKWRVDEIPMENLICPGVVIDITQQVHYLTFDEGPGLFRSMPNANQI